MAERGAQIDKDQVVAAYERRRDGRQALSEFARRRRRHRQMRPMMFGLAATTTNDGGEQPVRPARISMNAGQTNDEISRANSQPGPLPQPPPHESAEIEAQLARLNELRLHDELSRSGGRIASVAGGQVSTSAGRMRMITNTIEMQQQQLPSAQQTQQQRVAELDNRLGGSGAGAVVVATTTAEYNRDQPQAQHHSQELAGHQVPLLVDNQYQPHHHHQQVPTLTSNTHDHLIASHLTNQYHHHHHHLQHDRTQYNTVDMQQVAFYPNHVQQQQVGYLLEEPPDAPLTSLLDLDEEAAHSQQQHEKFHQSHGQLQARVSESKPSEPVGARLPESVIRVNNWNERKLSSYDQFYGNSSGSGGQLGRQQQHQRVNEQSHGELTTLNSAAAASMDCAQQPHLVHHHHHDHPTTTTMHHSHHRRNDSTSSFNLSTNSTSSILGTGGGNGAYGRSEFDGYSSTTSALVASSSHQLLPAHNLYEDDNDDDEDEQKPLRSRANDRTSSRRANSNSGNRARAASRRHAAATPAGSDDADEVKVCEWHGCGNTFLDMKDFVRHLEERHVNMEPPEKNRFFCMWTDCKRNNQEFNARYKLLIHMRVHSGEKPFTCDQSPHCKKSFSRLENLKIHKRSHTGEKPYRCNYEHCSKSFTNSSDRIKHHKTHKDPKPYTCTHEGCTKRYTDPSSLRKHLRAHKRLGDGPEVLGDHGPSHSSSSAAHLYLGQNHHHPYQSHLQAQQHQELSFSASYQTAREHITPPQVQPSHLQAIDNHAQQQQYSFHHQQAYVSESYTTTLDHSKQMYDQQPVSQQPYLRADYDPAKEFESVLLGTSNASTITTRDDQLSSSFKRPQQSQHHTDLTFVQSTNQQLEHSSQQHRFSTKISAPPLSQSFNEAQLRQHERLSRSWCVGNSARSAPPARRQHFATAGAPDSAVRSQHHPNQNQYHIKRSQDFGHSAAQSQQWSSPTTGNWSQATQSQSQVVESSSEDQSFAPYSTSTMSGSHHAYQQTMHQSTEHWPSTISHGEPSQVAASEPTSGPRTGHRVQFQQQQQQFPSDQQQQRQLTRQQQHEQLMRSMPANVNL